MTALSPLATLQTIADRAGVSRAAVSLALRNQPGVSKSTRERIHQIAAEEGYRPNPMVSALMAHLKRGRPPSDGGSIPFLTCHSTRHGWREYSTFSRYFTGASERAQQAGYRLEEMWLKEPGMTSRKMRRILVHRGVEGILVGPLPKGMGHISMDLAAFAVATVGHSVVRPRMHRAVCAHIESVRIVLHHLRHLGYVRIGLALSEMQDRRNDFNWSTAYAGYQVRLPPAERIPILYTDRAGEPKFERWLDAWRPQAIISGNLAILEKLASAGRSVPDDVGVAILDRSPQDEGVAGIDQQFEAVGAAAVDLVISQINRNERGIPKLPKLILTDGLWVPGTTVRKLPRTSPSATPAVRLRRRTARTTRKAKDR